ncbi:hypothetical protein [Bilophila wadsworthia]|uniref:hypothetical protein n=1 Tax=Bilophila wadsworthia TaxID=35833 RepID=UPI002A83A212|nr:hypothetical protein [Bilophila wadsworthia]MDY3682846.1 hypothetical protein [Bilophila wadsworthia]
MTQKKSPTGSNPQGKKRNVNVMDDGMNTTPIPLAGQGFCAPCPYFRAVKLASGRVRRVCSFHGVRVGVYGVPGCEFMKPEGGRHA